jgi:hypothetical protein
MPTLEAFLNHPIETLERALHIRRQIDQLNEVLKELFGPTPISLAGVQTPVSRRKGRRTRSPETKAKMAAAQQARWAKKKTSATAEKGKADPAAKKKKGAMSAEGRARIVAAQKARWAKVKAGKAASVPVKAGRAKRKQ